MDHDQRFKTLIREFFAMFLRLFFADWEQTFDLNAVEWLDKEVLPNPPDGSRHVLDMVAKLRTKQPVSQEQPTQPECSLALVHIEIESPDRTTQLKPRLPSYYVHLRDAHQLPVLPIAIYLKVALDGVGIDVYAERFGKLEVLRFSYLYVGLPGLNGLEYVRGDNWLGVALSALMRIPSAQVVALGQEALRRLTEAPLTDQQKYLLTDCVEAYLPLNEEQRVEFERHLASEPMMEVRAMNKTTFEKGMEKGRQEEMLDTLFRLGRKRFGPPPREVETTLRKVSDLSVLRGLTERILDVESWDALLQTAGRL